MSILNLAKYGPAAKPELLGWSTIQTQQTLRYTLSVQFSRSPDHLTSEELSPDALWSSCQSRSLSPPSRSKRRDYSTERFEIIRNNTTHSYIERFPCGGGCKGLTLLRQMQNSCSEGGVLGVLAIAVLPKVQDCGTQHVLYFKNIFHLLLKKKTRGAHAKYMSCCA